MIVLTSTGYKDIVDITPADLLVAYEVGTGNIIYNNLISKEFWTVSNDPDNPDLEYFTINGTWTLCGLESIWRNSDQVCHVSELKIGDIIFDENNNDVAITSITSSTATGWWRLQVTGDHSYIADGLTQHNASRWWSGNATPTSANWTYNSGGITNWGSASGVADNATPPATGDLITFDGAGAKGNANSTVNTGTPTINSLDMQAGYTATLTLGNVLTVSGGTASFVSQSTLASTAGTFTTATTVTFNVNADKIFSIPFVLSGTVTFNNNWETTNNINTAGTLLGNINIKVGGNLFTNAAMGTSTNCTFIMNGTNASLYSNASNYYFYANITVNTTGTITIGTGSGAANSLAFGNGKTLLWTNGTVNQNNSSTTLYLITGAILNGWNGISWSNITTASNSNQTITIGNLLTINGTLTIGTNSAVTFAGAAGWTANAFTITSASSTNGTCTLQQGNTYTVTNAFTANSGTPTSRPKLVSSSGSSHVIFTVNNGASVYVGNFDATYIDSSAGRTVWDWGANVVLSNTLNWNNLTDMPTTVNVGFS